MNGADDVMTIEATREREYNGQRFHLAGWKRDLPDPQRDLKFQSFRMPMQLPDKGSVKQWAPRIEDQSWAGSCVGHGVTSSLELNQIRMGRPARELSRLFTYDVARLAEGTPLTEDSGVSIRTAVRCTTLIGVPLETTWAYDLNRLAQKPSDEAYAEAALHKSKSYRRCDGVDPIRAAIHEGYAVPFGFRVPKKLFTPDAMNSGVVPFPEPGDGFDGGHCVYIVEYDDAERMFVFGNSWGTSWGKDGFGAISYKFFESMLADDAWALTDQEYYARRADPTPDEEAAA